jgi:hypothetical protein
LGRDPFGVGVDGTDGTILVTDTEAGTDCHAGSTGTDGCGALFLVDPNNGTRTMVSDFGNPSQGPLGDDPVAVVRDTDSSYLVLDSVAGQCSGGCGALFSVDRAGNRRVLTDFGNASQGPGGGQPFGLALADGAILTTGCQGSTPGVTGICRVDRVTGVRTLISDFGNPAQGPVGSGPLTLSTHIVRP